MSEPNAAHAATAETVPDLYGLVAEFDEVEALEAAADRAREAGYRTMDAYTPYPVEGLDDRLGFAPTRLGWIVLAAGHRRCARGLLPAVLRERDLLSDEHRRQAAQQLAQLHRDHVRGHRAALGLHRRSVHAG